MQPEPNSIPKFVDKASNAARKSPADPQWWLAGSTHPYAPFVGNALKWESYCYDDGTTCVARGFHSPPVGRGCSRGCPWAWLPL